MRVKDGKSCRRPVSGIGHEIQFYHCAAVNRGASHPLEEKRPADGSDHVGALVPVPSGFEEIGDVGVPPVSLGKKSLYRAVPLPFNEGGVARLAIALEFYSNDPVARWDDPANDVSLGLFGTSVE